MCHTAERAYQAVEQGNKLWMHTSITPLLLSRRLRLDAMTAISTIDLSLGTEMRLEVAAFSAFRRTSCMTFVPPRCTICTAGESRMMTQVKPSNWTFDEALEAASSLTFSAKERLCQLLTQQIEDEVAHDVDQAIREVREERRARKSGNGARFVI